MSSPYRYPSDRPDSPATGRFGLSTHSPLDIHGFFRNRNSWPPSPARRTRMRARSLAGIKGSTLIEALLSINILALLVTLLLTGLYFNFARLWLGHWLYEGTYCLIGPQSPGICTQLVKRKAQQLPFGHITRLKLHRSTRLVRGHLRFHLFAEHDLNLSKEIHLQLARVSGE